jgi:glycosyltransferase involved in cell wall biosynthesis
MRTTGESGLVSVVIPVRDCERYLGEAIESVLAQDYGSIEVIVVDDGSTDSSAAVAHAFGAPVRVVVQPPAGVGTAVNRGISESRGEVLAFVDSDDLWTPRRLVRQLAALAEGVDAAFVHVDHFVHEDRGASTRPTQPGYCRGGMAIRRASFDRVGFFTTELVFSDFIEWYTRAVDCGLTISLLPEVGLLRRVHDRNLGVRQRGNRIDYTHAIKSILDRRRARP